MEKSEFVKILKECILEALGDEFMCCSLSTLGNQDLLTNFGLNSLNVIKLIIKVEERFGLEFDDSDISMKHWQNIDSIISLLERKDYL